MNTEGLFRAAFDYAVQTIVRNQNPLPPTWTLINEADEITVLMTPWRDNNEKLLIEMMMKLEMRERKTIAYGIVTEAWIAKVPEGWTPGEDLPLQPRKNPDRREVVLAFVTDGKTVTTRMWAIKRDWHDRVTSLELEKSSETPDGFEGWMTKMLSSE